MSSFRFGKHPPKHDYRTLRLKNYLTDALPAPKPAYDALQIVCSKLGAESSAIPALFPMDGNDRLGDCTIAAAAHAITVWDGLVGKRKVMPEAAVTKLYMHLTGGLDSGLNELDVLNQWRQKPVDGERILAFAAIDVKNHTQIQQAIELFGGVYLGFQVQQGCQQEFEAHTPWTPGPLTQEGHAVYAVAHDAQGVTVLTWGSTQKATWAWWDECVDETYAILPPEAKTADFAPGFSFDQLVADLKAVASD